MGDLLFVLASALLLGLSTLLAGQLVALMSLNIFQLRSECAEKNPESCLVYPIRARGAEMWIGLSSGLVIVNTALTVMLAKFLTGGGLLTDALTIAISSLLIMVFSNMLPIYAFSRHSLKLSAMFAPYTSTYLDVIRPIVMPVAKLIEGGPMANEPPLPKEELIELISEFKQSDDPAVDDEEIRIAKSALTFGDVRVIDVMTPRRAISALKDSLAITTSVLDQLYKSGFSRFPVYSEQLDNIVGILYLRKLVVASSHHETIGSAMNKDVFFVNENQNLEHVLSAFVKTKSHLFVVINEFKEVTGVITIEDVLEQIIGKKIVDEFDHYDDMRTVASLQAKKIKRRIV